MKTIAARMLDRMKIEYELRTYEFSEEEMDAISVAQKIGMPPNAVFKTLVARGDRTGVVMACIPASAGLDLKKLATATGNKRVELVPVKEIQSLTGYVRGGVSPVGSKKKFPVFIDQCILGSERVSVSAGLRGLQMILAPESLLRASQAQLAEIANSSSGNDNLNAGEER